MDVVSNKKISRLVATQGMTRVYEMDDGTWTTAREGTVAWRNNNPGNLKFEFHGSADKSVQSKRGKDEALDDAQRRYKGVVDLDQWGNAVFESYEAGRQAQKKLVTDSHGDHTVEELVKGYSKADYSGKTHHTNQVATIYATADAEGFDLRGKIVRDMTIDEKNALLDGIARAEHWKAGTTQHTDPLTDDQLREALHASALPSNHVRKETSAASNVHRQGDKGEAVGRLQEDLATLNIRAHDGSSIRSDQHFGPKTKEAVEAFQSAHGLHVDGVAGPATLASIAKAKSEAQVQSPLAAETKASAPSLLDTHHPAHGIYEQAFQCVSRIDAERGQGPGAHTQMFAGALTSAATASGFKRIDHVILSDDASRSWAVQGDLTSPFKQYTEVDVMKAIQTPLQQSSQEAAEHLQANVQNQQQAQTQQQSMQHDAMQQLTQQGSSLSR
ncbi:hypothetical protein GCM10009552_13800 [Rothia nasimurium]|uniref:Peptidoglycan-binding protein n=1 Tax=Luteibacter anthropi TaxID=564369 RepID=A0A7X5ZJR0_9GAMM|nr:peptidoglycan-binding domain-containing protein [Luteibacter anthropi]NII08268.1 peptidoglycan-binding protein [Luteibacter anthropi]